MYDSIVKILNGVKDQIIQQYDRKKIRASGSFANNITVARQGRYKVVLTLPPYAEYITKFKSNKGGRGPGPIKGYQRILQKWISDKGFPLRDYLTGRFMPKTPTNLRKVAYLIGRKIYNKGTDIHLRKRQPIDLDEIVDGQFDYRGEELADRILQQIKI